MEVIEMSGFTHNEFLNLAGRELARAGLFSVDEINNMSDSDLVSAYQKAIQTNALNELSPSLSSPSLSSPLSSGSRTEPTLIPPSPYSTGTQRSTGNSQIEMPEDLSYLDEPVEEVSRSTTQAVNPNQTQGVKKGIPVWVKRGGKWALIAGGVGTVATGAGIGAYQALSPDQKELINQSPIGNALGLNTLENQLDIEEEKVKAQAEEDWNRLRPYMLTPVEQLELGQRQAQNRLDLESVALNRKGKAQMLANRISNQIQAMNASTNAVANILGQTIY